MKCKDNLGTPKLAIGIRSKGSLIDYISSNISDYISSNISVDERSVGESLKEIGYLHTVSNWIFESTSVRYLLIIKGKIIIEET